MNVHKNARLTPLGRERIVRQVESGQTAEAVSEAAGVCPRTVRKWACLASPPRLRLAEPVRFQATTRSGTRTLSLVSGP
jgi:transposase-like protein